jgi:hypothetical protein
MRKSVIMIALALLLVACSFNKIDGNGEIITKKINTVKNISALNVSGAFDVEVNIADSTSLSVTTDENLMKFIGLKISGETLKIYTKENLSPTDEIKISLTTPHLIYVELSGANDLKINGLNEEEFKTDCSGASSLILSGKVNKFDAEISGSADMNALNLIVNDARLDVSGAANAKIFAKKFLRVSASGAADIEYAGNPELVNVDVSGAASVNKISTDKK